MVNIREDMNIMHPILQSDNSHEDVDHTGHIVTDTCKANIDNQNVINDPAGGTIIGNYSNFSKDTKTFEFLTSAEPKSATIGSLVRFMWNPGTGSSSCWVQGEIYKRIDTFKDARKERWDSNKVVIRNLVIINHWGEEHLERLPNSMIINLHRNQIWALGTEVVMKQIGGNKAPNINTNKVASGNECLNEDTEGIQTEKSVRSPANTIKDDAKNNSDTSSTLVTVPDDMKETKRMHVSTVNN